MTTLNCKKTMNATREVEYNDRIFVVVVVTGRRRSVFQFQAFTAQRRQIIDRRVKERSPDRDRIEYIHTKKFIKFFV